MKYLLLIVIIAAIVVAARMFMPSRTTGGHLASTSSDQPVPPVVATPPTDTARVKGDEASKTYHTEDSPDFDHLPGEVWFESEESARTSGFTRWDQMR